MSYFIPGETHVSRAAQIGESIQRKKDLILAHSARHADLLVFFRAKYRTQPQWLVDLCAYEALEQEVSSQHKEG